LNDATPYRLLNQFQSLFSRKYEHRNSTHGDRLALELYEDLYGRALARSKSSNLVTRVNNDECVANPRNKSYGKSARRGDGTLGELMHGAPVVMEPGFIIKRGTTVITEIGVEVKILAKAMIKQLDRVVGDLGKQVTQFETKGGSRPPICVGIVGVNHSTAFLSYEGSNTYLADGTRQPNGKTYARPCDEAARAKHDLNSIARPQFFEFLILEFEATNIEPYPFKWVNSTKTVDDYNALLSRLAYEYEARF
jgi:hypothetical protein